MIILHNWASVLRKARAELKETDLLRESVLGDVRAGQKNFIMKTVSHEVGAEDEETAEHRGHILSP
jgi:hypothetical protein